MRSRSRQSREGGQIIVLFVVSLTAIFAMAALLFDGAHALVLRRQQQNASDTAALKAANLIQSLGGCSATAGPPIGSPRPAITAAAVTAVQAALPGIAASSIHVSCPGAYWDNWAVQVDVDGHSPTFFGTAVGVNGFDVRTTSQAVNGPVAPAPWSVLLLDDSTLSWPNGRRGCPSGLISGGPTIVLEGSIMIDSDCDSAHGGALGTNGNAATITLNNNARIKIVGDYVPGALTISPTPLTGQNPVSDPLKNVTPMSSWTLPIRATNRQVFGGADQVLEPGVYVGGIQLKNNVKAYLHPGIYVFQGGGLDIGAQNAIYSLPSGMTTTTDATWATDCLASNCGVLLYNTGTSSTAMGPITVNAGATMKLRPYLNTVDGTGVSFADYNNLLFWQNRQPEPASNFAQPQVTLSGGGNVDISGTVYAPSAVVYMTGGAGGSGGGTDLTLQFICWDMTIQGNSTFHFYYQNNKFAKPPDYGLIK
jgi:putative Flp pilus-assembly TadE/G-like protein